MRRSENRRRGKQAEERVYEYLKNFGKVAFMFGRNGFPDILFERDNIRYGIEVKSTYGVIGGKIGRVYITRKQWDETNVWCEKNDAIPSLVLEVISRSNGHKFYIWIRGEKVEKMMENVKNYWSLTVWQALEIGDLIKNEREVF